MPIEKRYKEVPLPFDGQKGVCCYCGKPLPPKKRRWCGNACVHEYLLSSGFFYRDVCIKQNIERYGHIECEFCGAAPPINSDRQQQLDKYRAENPGKPDAYYIAYEIDDWVADHKIPLALGGKHERDNLWLLCPECNKRKTAVDAGRIAKVRSVDKKIVKREMAIKRHRSLDSFGGDENE